MTAPKVVVLLHGYEGNEADHWQTWLADRLPEHGVAVRYPQLPDPFAPDLAAWATATRDVLAADGAEGRVVVAHSLACHLWAHVAADAGERLADRVLLVAPPGRAETTQTFPRLPPGPVVATVLDRVSPDTQLLLGANDPWRKDGADYRDAGLPVHDVRGGAHLNVAAGLGPWPAMLDLVLGRSPGPLSPGVGG